MSWLPLANILHCPFRSILSAIGIGVGVCLLVTLTGLSRGSLYEIADRMESVDAELIVMPRGWGDDSTVRSGVGLSSRLADVLRRDHADLVERAAPVFADNMYLAGQNHRILGVNPADWDVVANGMGVEEGRLFDPDGAFAEWIEWRLRSPDAPAEAITGAELSAPEHSGLELVIDRRLADAGGFRVGQTVRVANHDWTIVGIAPTGVMTRGFVPLRTAQYLFGVGDISKCTMIFVKLRPGVDVGPAAATLAEAVGQDVIPVSAYRGMLVSRLGLMFTFVHAINVVALAIAFLFVMTTLYTLVLQRTREIAILKSCGAGGWFLLRQVLAESLLLAGLGTAIGLGMALLAGWLIQRLAPLLTVQFSWAWVAIAAGSAGVGAILSGLYPAWRAARIDMVEALAYE